MWFYIVYPILKTAYNKKKNNFIAHVTEVPILGLPTETIHLFSSDEQSARDNLNINSIRISRKHCKVLIHLPFNVIPGIWHPCEYEYSGEYCCDLTSLTQKPNSILNAFKFRQAYL